MEWSYNSKVEGEPGLFVKSAPAEVKARIVKETADWSQQIKHLVLSTPADTILELPVMERKAISIWHSGRIILIGDAAHGMPPFLGQGGNMAFEDAYVLSVCLSKWQSGKLSSEEALLAFDNLQLPRSNSVLLRSSESLKSLRETAVSPQVINDFYVGPQEVETSKYSMLSTPAADFLNWVYSGPAVVQI